MNGLALLIPVTLIIYWKYKNAGLIVPLWNWIESNWLVSGLNDPCVVFALGGEEHLIFGWL